MLNLIVSHRDYFDVQYAFLRRKVMKLQDKEILNYYN